MTTLPPAPAVEHRPLPPPPPAGGPRRAPGRVIAFVLAVFLLLGAAGTLAGATWVGDLDDRERHDGYLTTDARDLGTTGHALTVEEIDLDGLSGDWILGRARLRATSADPADEVFIGIARTDDVDDYLGEVEHSTVTDVDDADADYEEHAGGSPAVAPTATDIWVAQASGPGTQSVRWTPDDGDWTVVIMRPDGAPGVEVTADVGATVPVLEGITTGLKVGAGVLGLAGLALLGGLLVRGRRSRLEQP